MEEEIVRLRAIWHSPALAELPAPKQGAPLLSSCSPPPSLIRWICSTRYNWKTSSGYAATAPRARRPGVNCSAFRVAEKNMPTIRPGSTSISNRKASHGSRSSRCGTADADGLHGHCSRRLKKLRQGAGTASVMRGYFHDTSGQGTQGKRTGSNLLYRRLLPAFWLERGAARRPSVKGLLVAEGVSFFTEGRRGIGEVSGKRSTGRD